MTIEYVFIFFIFLFGLAIGSFLNMAIWRLYTHESFLGRSRCTVCHHIIPWCDNIPLFSYLFLKGTCRYCKKHISYQYPLIELATAVLFMLAYWSLGGVYNTVTSLELLRLFFFISILIIIFVYDFRWYLILDIVTIPAIVAAYILNLFLGMNWLMMLIAGTLGGGFFLLQYVLSKGTWIGGGDIRLGALMGVMLGYPHIITVLMVSYLMGGIFAIPLLVTGKKQFGDKLPFGTFLTVATIITLLTGDSLWQWYISIII